MKFPTVMLALVPALFASPVHAQADVDVSLGSVAVPSDASAEIELSVSGNGVSRGLQIRLDFDDSPIDAVDLDDCLDGFVGLGQHGSICSHPPGQPGRIRILLNAGPGEAINDFTGVLRFQLDGSLPAGSTIDLSWDEPFATATNPGASVSQADGQIEVLGPSPGELALSPSMIDFGGVVFGSLDHALVTAANVAPASSPPVEVADIELSGDPDFQLTGNGTCQVGSVLEAQAAGCQLEIAFAPGTAADFNGTLTVASADGQSVQVPITGQGLPAPASVALSDLVQVYTGKPLAPTVITAPPGLDVTVSFDGEPDPPVEAGTYSVEAVVSDPDYSGQSSAAFEILGDEILRDRFQEATSEMITGRGPDSR